MTTSNTNRIDAEFCIVGAGPAGLTLALLLLRSGASVALVERSRSFVREFRGEILQPGGLAVLDEIGVLDRVIGTGAHRLSGFRMTAEGRTMMEVDYRRVPGPYKYLLSIPQQQLLQELLTQCRRYEEFAYIDGSHPDELRTDTGRITGIQVGGAAGSLEVRTPCVIGADGRHSKIRRLAAIEYDRSDISGHDLLWFRIPATEAEPDTVRIINSAGSAVVIHRSYPNMVQIGWAMPRGQYREFAVQGPAEIRRRVARALPGYADAIDAEITDLGRMTLLDVFAGRARQWVADGIVLVGDAAHTHGPLGAQGINLALQDAAVLHPILLEARRRNDFGAGTLSAFPARRTPEVDRIMRFQGVQSRTMFSQGRLAATVRAGVLGLIRRTPVFPRISHRIAYGDPDIHVRTDLFTADRRNPCA
ncbi:FAD-dependent monooxygenase [Nocardia sp. NPDC020380]|uniref:FAD-dependent monooxygenase n=1 Tax=Nocardia sp. NPDC020380 TaxID=3364309 RepID=UPI003792C152